MKYKVLIKDISISQIEIEANDRDEAQDEATNWLSEATMDEKDKFAVLTDEGYTFDIQELQP